MKPKKQKIYEAAIKKLIKENEQLKQLRSESLYEISNRQLVIFNKHNKDDLIVRIGLNLDQPPVSERSITNIKQAASTGKKLVKQFGSKIFAVLVDSTNNDFITGILEIPVQGRIKPHIISPGRDGARPGIHQFGAQSDAAASGDSVANYVYFFNVDESGSMKRAARRAATASQAHDPLAKKGPGSVAKQQYFKQMNQSMDPDFDPGYFKRMLRRAH